MGARKTRGSMLVVALGILTLMSILALTFASIMNLEKTASKNYVDNIKSRFIADAGIARFVAELRSSISRDPSGSEIASRWFYAPRRENGAWVSDYGVPLEDEDGTMHKQTSSGSDPVEVEGFMGASYPGGSDDYRVKLIDATGQFNLNLYDVGETGDVGDGYFSWLLARMLQNLGESIRRSQGLSYNPIDSFEYGTGGAVGMVEFRRSLEGQKFDSKTQLRDYLPPEDYDIIDDFVTTVSWVDERAVVSNDGVNPFSRPTTVRSTALDEEVVIERSPININTAPKEVLAAVIAGVAGRSFYELPQNVSREDLFANAPNASWQWDRTQEETDYELDSALVYTEPIDVPRALGIAERIIAVRNSDPYPFTSFAQWDDFVDRHIPDNLLPDPGACQVVMVEDGPASYRNVAGTARGLADFPSFYRAACRSVLKANFNPAYISSSYNPDYVAARASTASRDTSYPRNPENLVSPRVDKANLLYPRSASNPRPSDNIAAQTTDWCFQTRGVYEMTSLGEIRDGDDRVVARDKVRSVIRLLDLVIQRTQRDFERNRHDYDDEPYEQQDFSPLGPDRGRFQVQTYPEDDRFWPAHSSAADDRLLTDRGGIADPTGGYVSIGVREASPAGGGFPATETGFAQFGTRFLEALWDRRRDTSSSPNLRREWWAATADGQQVTSVPTPNPFAGPFGAPVQGSSTVVPIEQRSGGGQLFPDGYYSTVRGGYFDPPSSGPQPWRADPDRKIPFLWFPGSFPRQRDAASDQEGWRYQGESDPDFLDYATGGWSGNVLPHRGGLEFWYKPDYDWGRPTGGGVEATSLMCGLFSISSVLENPSAPGSHEPGNDGFSADDPMGHNDGDYTSGTQIFGFRNTQGDLRVTFLYYEVVGKDDGNTVSSALGTFRKEIPNPYEAEVEDPQSGATSIEQFNNIQDYYDRYAEPGISRSLQWPPKEIAGDLLDTTPPPDGDGVWESWDPARTTEPSPLFSQNGDSFGVRYARVDAFVRARELLGWKAGEWHHLAVRWDADQTNPNEFLQIWVDGQEQTTAVHSIPTSYDSRPSHRMFVRLNEPPYPTRVSGSGDSATYNPARPMDQFMIGGIARLQLGRGGMFKWVDGDESWALIPANGTIDDVRTYDGVGSDVDTPFRYWQSAGGFPGGIYENRFALDGRFPTPTSELDLAGLYWQAYVPDTFGGQPVTDPGRVEVELMTGPDPASMSPTGGGRSWPPSGDPFNIHAPSYASASATGGTVPVDPSTEVGYRVNFYPSRVGAREVASPILDEVGLIYFLPKEEVIYTERVYD